MLKSSFIKKIKKFSKPFESLKSWRTGFWTHMQQGVKGTWWERDHSFSVCTWDSPLFFAGLCFSPAVQINITKEMRSFFPSFWTQVTWLQMMAFAIFGKRKVEGVGEALWSCLEKRKKGRVIWGVLLGLPGFWFWVHCGHPVDILAGDLWVMEKDDAINFEFAF